MVGSALLTIVLDSIATNIARRRPLRASSTWRCVISPLCSAVTGGAWVTAVLRSVAISNSCSPQPYGCGVCSAIRRRRDLDHPAPGPVRSSASCEGVPTGGDPYGAREPAGPPLGSESLGDSTCVPGVSAYVAGSPPANGRRRGDFATGSRWTTGRGQRSDPGHAATRRPAAPLGGAPGDDTGGLRVGWLRWIRRQLSADRAALAGSHLTHPKRTHSSDHLPSVCLNRTSARGGAQRINRADLRRRRPRRPPRTASGRAGRRRRPPRAAARASPARRSIRPP